MAVKAKVPTKRLKKQIKSLRKGLKKEERKLKKAQKTAKKAVSKATKLGGDMILLKKEVQKLKKKKLAKKQLNEYNLFMRKQLKAGKTFRQAVSAWKRFKKLLSKRRPSAYNQFIAAQMRMGKTFKQAVAAWKAFKSGKKPRARTRIIRKVIVRRAKPKIIVRRGKPRIIRKIVVRRSKPKIIRKIIVRRIRQKKAPRAQRRTVSVEVQKPSFSLSEIETVISKTLTEKIPAGAIQPSEEELALAMTRLYFEEIARLGFKRSLDLDEIINAYFYSLLRIKRSGIELPEIVEAVKKSKIKRSEF